MNKTQKITLLLIIFICLFGIIYFADFGKGQSAPEDKTKKILNLEKKYLLADLVQIHTWNEFLGKLPIYQKYFGFTNIEDFKPPHKYHLFFPGTNPDYPKGGYYLNCADNYQPPSQDQPPELNINQPSPSFECQLFYVKKEDTNKCIETLKGSNVYESDPYGRKIESMMIIPGI